MKQITSSIEENGLKVIRSYYEQLEDNLPDLGYSSILIPLHTELQSNFNFHTNPEGIRDRVNIITK
jgi:ribosomal protein L9